ncbi:MAG: hypothetical protein ACOX17_05425 [Christensenellales bacterium]
MPDWIIWVIRIFIWFSFGSGIILMINRIRLDNGIGIPLLPVPVNIRFSLRTVLLLIGVALASRGLVAALGFLTHPGSTLSDLWNRWDAPHYLTIASEGYTADTSLGDNHLFIVFYPLYPWLVRLLGGGFTGATVVSWAALAVACVLLWYWCEENTPGDGGWAASMLLTFPTGVFLGAPYTESLFLLTSIGCLWSLRRRKFWASGLFGFAAALTRNLGILLALPYVITYLLHHRLLGSNWKEAWKDWKKPRICLDRLAGIFFGLIILSGFGMYLGLNYYIYGDALKFLEIQKSHWHQSIGSPLNTFSYTIINAQQTDDWVKYMWIPQLGWMIASLLLLPGFMKKLPLAEAAYTVVYIFVAMSPTWLLSFPRYLMGMATLYPGLIKLLKRPWMRWAWCIIMGAWMCWWSILFCDGKPIL